MFGEPRLEPSWVNDMEWDEKVDVECENEVDSHPEGVECNEHCTPEDGNHLCGFSGAVEATCVGQREYTAYFTCPQCGTDGQREMDNSGDW